MRAVLCLASVLLVLALVGASEPTEADAEAKFFSDNLKNPEVVALPSGTQYRRVRYGAGVVHPTEDTACDMHYETHNATRFLLDSSYARNQPTTLSPSQVKLVLKYDLSDVMPLMVEGDIFDIFVPSKLGPLDGLSGVTIFRLELIRILFGGSPAVKCDPITLQNCQPKEVSYAQTAKPWSADKLNAERARLLKIYSQPLKLDQQLWVVQRAIILGRLLHAKSKDEL